MPNPSLETGEHCGSNLSTVDFGSHKGITMVNLIDELSSRARTLPAADRIRLAEELLATVNEADDEVEVAWDEEIRRRIADIDAGTVKLIPAEEVFAEVRRLFK